MSTGIAGSLNPGQRAAYDLAMRNDVTLLTGPGGTGKSYVVNELVSRFEAVVAAPTALAALNVGGETIHRAFGVRPGHILDPANDGTNADQNLRELWTDREFVLARAELLILDEISMVRADLLDAVDRRLRKIRRDPSPFGGLRVILSGDCYQLPPILRRGNEAQAFCALGLWPSEWWFDAAVVRELLATGGLAVAKLGQQMRQDGDAEFAAVLNRVRSGRFKDTDLRFLNQRVVRRQPTSTSVLYGDNHNVDRINEAHIDTLHGEAVTFDRVVESARGRPWAGNGVPSETVRLRVGALVSLTRNHQEDGETVWVNGDTARVVGLDAGSVTVQLNRDGSQHTIAAPAELKRLHDQGETVPCWEQRSHAVVGGRVRSTVDACAFQVPLRVAAATTIHKSQGQTLDAAFVGGDLGWNPGLAYVALSRVRSLSGLHLGSPLTQQSVRTDPRVRDFQRRLRASKGAMA